MSTLLTLLSIIILGFTTPMSSNAATISPKDILSKADAARGNTQGVQWHVKIESIENGRKNAQTMRIKARNFNVLAETLAPAKAKGRKIVMVDRNMWFVRPGLRKPVPISPRQRLVGGASNGDIASTNYAGDYDIVKMSEATLNNEPCYLFDLKARNKAATYDRIQYWVSKPRLVGVQAEFYTVSGRRLKSATFAYDNRVEIGGEHRPFVSKMVITNAVVKANVTTMIYSKTRVKKIPDAAFNLNLLLR